MCGIIGYIGSRPAAPLLLEGLYRLEYRGYDSAGMAIGEEGGITLRKRAGRVAALDELLGRRPAAGSIGVGHTRWATHGKVTDANSHPHVGGTGEVVLVHNGVIENHGLLRDRLAEQGYAFHSDTDSEAVAHLVAEHLGELRRQGFDPHNFETCLAAVTAALAELEGTYGLAILFRDCPGLLMAVRNGSPLVVGVAEGEHFIASDAGPLVRHTDQVVYLADREIALLTRDNFTLMHREGGRAVPEIRVLDERPDDAELGEFPHYMLKEIHEQPTTIENALRGRIDFDEATAKFGGLNLSPQDLSRIDRIVLTACGTSWHAALVGEYLLEEFARIPTEVEYASELRYRNPPLSDRTMIFAITQSGETADTLAAMRECKRKGQPTLAICNVVGSSIAREADGGIYLHAGPEIGVASTKAFTSQVTVLMLLALYLGRMRHLSEPAGRRLIEELQRMPEIVEETLRCNERVREVAQAYYQANNILYLGRLYNFPVALEGALKLKEISYIHAEGYPAAEMKHGPIALVDERTPSVFIAPGGHISPKVMSNIEEVKARGGPVIAIAGRGDEKIAEIADDVIPVPNVEEHLQPIVTAIPLQLLAYHCALLRGCNVDRPRNLAKSVTVE